MAELDAVNFSLSFVRSQRVVCFVFLIDSAPSSSLPSRFRFAAAEGGSCARSSFFWGVIVWRARASCLMPFVAFFSLFFTINEPSCIPHALYHARPKICAKTDEPAPPMFCISATWQRTTTRGVARERKTANDDESTFRGKGSSTSPSSQTLSLTCARGTWLAPAVRRSCRVISQAWYTPVAPT